jgi:Ni/Co efflux regulator RcnB
MRLLVLILALALGAGPALGQSGERRQDARAKQRNMKDEDRQRMRDDVRDAYRERRGRPERPRQMSPEERDKLRRDVEDANRQLRRR